MYQVTLEESQWTVARAVASSLERVRVMCKMCKKSVREAQDEEWEGWILMMVLLKLVKVMINSPANSRPRHAQH